MGISTRGNHIQNEDRESCVIGIYLYNGVFYEDEKNRGISYILDHLIYKKLYEKLDYLGCGHVRARTSYGYSSFLVRCDKKHYAEVLKIVIDNMLSKDWDCNEIEDWIKERKEWSSCYSSTEQVYRSKRMPFSPLSKSLSGWLQKTPTRRELEEWQDKYYKKELLYILPSNAPDGFATMPTSKRNALPDCEYVKIGLPKCIPWSRSNVYISFPLPKGENDCIIAEALCKWLARYISQEANRQNATLTDICFCPDYVPECVMKIQCRGRREEELYRSICKLISSMIPRISEKELSAVRKRLFGEYLKMYKDPEEWNLFKGYNLMSGNRYDIDGLVDFDYYERHITEDKILNMLNQMKNSVEISIFACSAAI